MVVQILRQHWGNISNISTTYEGSFMAASTINYPLTILIGRGNASTTTILDKTSSVTPKLLIIVMTCAGQKLKLSYISLIVPNVLNPWLLYEFSLA